MQHLCRCCCRDRLLNCIYFGVEVDYADEFYHFKEQQEEKNCVLCVK